MIAETEQTAAWNQDSFSAEWSIIGREVLLDSHMSFVIDSVYLLQAVGVPFFRVEIHASSTTLS
jgi:hypothetical protein